MLLDIHTIPLPLPLRLGWVNCYLLKTSQALAVFVLRLEERPLFAFVARHNTASVRVLEKCGFRLLEEVEDEYIYYLDR